MRKLLLSLIFSAAAWSQVTVIQAPVPKFRSFLPSGSPNVGGCVYTFASGTSTPQATYTDLTGTIANSNPVILDANGEAPIWISGTTYRFQVWSFGSGVIGSNCGNGSQLYQVDGIRDTGLNALNGPITIAPTANGIDIFTLVRATDVSPSGNFVNFKSFAGATLFKVDINGNVTGGGFAGSGAISGTTGTFTGAISGTTGAFTGGVLNLTEVGSPPAPAGIDVLTASSANHRLMGCNNGASCFQLVVANGDINNSDQVIGWHFGATSTPLSGTAPTTGQVLQWDGAHIIGAPALEATFGMAQNAGPLNIATCTTTLSTGACNQTVFAAAHTLVRFTYIVNIAPVTCSPNAVIGVRDVTASSNLTTSTVTAAAGTFVDSGALSVAMPAGHTYVIGLLTAAAGCGTNPQAGWFTMVYQ